MSNSDLFNKKCVGIIIRSIIIYLWAREYAGLEDGIALSVMIVELVFSITYRLDIAYNTL